MNEYRIEQDTMGQIKVPADRLWGPQTQRSLENFAIGAEKMPIQVIRALSHLKKAAAAVNVRYGKLSGEMAKLIGEACEEICSGNLDGHFPLSVWQTGSGTQTNMNVNEVIANYGNKIAGTKLLHPNDHVNMSQSSNDVFPSAMHMAAVIDTEKLLLPAVKSLASAFLKLETENPDVIKIGRTHLQDATPIKFSQEVSAWRRALEKSGHMIKTALDDIRELAIGGTAVGTGINAPDGFGQAVTELLSETTGIKFYSADNKFHSLTMRDGLVFFHGSLKALAADLIKIANDIRFLASGPRCGYGEIGIPENEPGSSIMPGKVNPTQCEAVTMAACQVMANDTAVSFSASQGNFQLNVYMPVCIYNVLGSIRLLADSCSSFEKNCVSGITVNETRMKEYLDGSLMLVTALNPYVGYDKAAMTAKSALKEGITLREAVIGLGFMTGDEFNKAVKPENMV